MKRTLSLVVLVALLVPSLLVSPEPAYAGAPAVTSVLEGRDSTRDRVTIVLIGNKVSKFKEWGVRNAQGAEIGSAELIMKSSKIITLLMPEGIVPGSYTLVLVWSRGNVLQPITISGGLPIAGTVMSDALEEVLRTDLDDAETLGGQDGDFYRDVDNVNAGTLGTDFFDAYADLMNGGRIGTGSTQLAHGDHEHDPYFTELELQSPGTLNHVTNPVHWTKLAGVPGDIADGTDSDTTYTAGEGIRLTGTEFSVQFDGEGVLAKAARSDHQHDNRYYTESELRTGGTLNSPGNPVAWTKLSGVPSGFADGVDDDTNTTYSAGTALSLTGTTLNVDLGTSGTQAATGDHLHTGDYVDRAGDDMTGALTITSTIVTALTATSQGANAAVLGDNNAISGQLHGVRGDTSSTRGSGVSGFGFALTGENYGVQGTVDSNAGRGVFGVAAASTGTTFGVYGQTSSTSGTGVYGTALAASGTTYGGQFETDSTTGRGVYGFADASTGLTYGGYFESDSNEGRGVHGLVDAKNGATVGGYFESNSTSGRGVYGFADASTGSTYGGYFEADSNTGHGVFGAANATAGESFGGYFVANSNVGRGVYGFADANSGTTYGGYFEADSSSGRGVYGLADSVSGENFGGYFEAGGTTGTGVFGVSTNASGTDNSGVSGEARSAEGRGVFGINTANTGASYGVWGETGSTAGTGVLGWVPHSGATADAAGVWGLNDGAAGAGVRGEASGNTGDHFGVHGICDSNSDTSAGVWAQATRTGGTALIAQNNNTNGEIAVFRTGTSTLTDRHTFDVDGDSVQTGDSFAVSHQDTSDARLKQDVEPVSGVLERLDRIRTVRYRFKDRGDGVSEPHIGVLAQEAQAQFPELVGQRPDGFLSVSYGGLSAINLQAVKELRGQVTAQQRVIAAQEREIERLDGTQDRVAELEERLARLEALLARQAESPASPTGSDR